MFGYRVIKCYGPRIFGVRLFVTADWKSTNRGFRVVLTLLPGTVLLRSIHSKVYTQANFMNSFPLGFQCNAWMEKSTATLSKRLNTLQVQLDSQSPYDKFGWRPTFIGAVRRPRRSLLIALLTSATWFFDDLGLFRVTEYKSVAGRFFQNGDHEWDEILLNRSTAIRSYVRSYRSWNFQRFWRLNSDRFSFTIDSYMEDD